MRRSAGFTMLEAIIALLVFGICLECIQGGVLFVGNVKKNWKEDLIIETFAMDVQLQGLFEKNELTELQKDLIKLEDIQTQEKKELRVTAHKLMLHYGSLGNKTLMYQVNKADFSYAEPILEMRLSLDNGRVIVHQFKVKPKKVEEEIKEETIKNEEKFQKNKSDK